MSAGTAKKIIDKIIATRSKGVDAAAKSVRTLIKLKGIDPDKFTSSTIDDPAVIQKINAIAKEMNVAI